MENERRFGLVASYCGNCGRCIWNTTRHSQVSSGIQSLRQRQRESGDNNNLPAETDAKAASASALTPRSQHEEGMAKSNTERKNKDGNDNNNESTQPLAALTFLLPLQPPLLQSANIPVIHLRIKPRGHHYCSQPWTKPSSLLMFSLYSD